MTTRSKTSHSETNHKGNSRAGNARALQLVREWLAEDSDYDATVFPVLQAELEADRLSYRRRFKE